MPKNQHIKEMNWGFLLFRGSYTYKKGLIVQSSSKTTQLLDPLYKPINLQNAHQYFHLMILNLIFYLLHDCLLFLSNVK